MLLTGNSKDERPCWAQLANLVGSMLPFFFKRVGLVPAVTSGPFIASMMDVAAILIYFSTAALVLHT